MSWCDGPSYGDDGEEAPELDRIRQIAGDDFDCIGDLILIELAKLLRVAGEGCADDD